MARKPGTCYILKQKFKLILKCGFWKVSIVNLENASLKRPLFRGGVLSSTNKAALLKTNTHMQIYKNVRSLSFKLQIYKQAKNLFNLVQTDVGVFSLQSLKIDRQSDFMHTNHLRKSNQRRVFEFKANDCKQNEVSKRLVKRKINISWIVHRDRIRPLFFCFKISCWSCIFFGLNSKLIITLF